jgi:aldehyde:ferredoxin oxidoreductase
MPGYMNRIAYVDLSNKQVRYEEPEDTFYRRYLGGWNLIALTLLRETPAHLDPLGPANPLVVATGVASGIPVSGLARNAVGAKSPLTGGFGASEVGGFFQTELKRAGFDAIIVQGQAEYPLYLWIHNGQVTLHDAAHLWGQKTADALARIRTELGVPRARAMLIGPGAENLVPYACISNDLKHFAGRCGLGAVMGAKKLKAIVAYGSQPVPVADPEKIKALGQWMRKNLHLAGNFPLWGTGAVQELFEQQGNLPVRNFSAGEYPQVKRQLPQTIREELGSTMEACYACAVHCKKRVAAEKPYPIDPQYGGPEYETLAAIGSNCCIADTALLCKANELLNAYTIDTISFGVSLAFAMECFEAGLLTLKDTDGLELRFGNGAVLLPAIEKVARREGFGAFLALGVKAMAKELGGGSERFAMHVKGQPYPMHEPRLKRGLALGYAVSPTGADHQHSLHDTGTTTEAGIEAMRPLGILEPVPLDDFGADKVRLAMRSSTASVARNCTVLCQFVPWSYPQIIELIQAATGWTDYSLYEWMESGERALNLARLFNLREGFSAADDWLPQRSFEPPINGALKNQAVQADQLREAIRLYYGMMGWDPETGIPTEGKLRELGLDQYVALAQSLQQKPEQPL